MRTLRGYLRHPWFWFFVASAFLAYAFGWQAAVAWYFICLYEKHNREALMRGKMHEYFEQAEEVMRGRMGLKDIHFD